MFRARVRRLRVDMDMPGDTPLVNVRARPQMIKMVDTDGDGQISFDEFVRLCKDPDPSRPDFNNEFSRKPAATTTTDTTKPPPPDSTPEREEQARLGARGRPGGGRPRAVNVHRVCVCAGESAGGEQRGQGGEEGAARQGARAPLK